MTVAELRTERLLLRGWRDDDREPFAAMNVDPEVMHYFPGLLDREAAVSFGFESVGLDEIVSFTVPNNERSRRVMERLGMHRDPADDFDHPRLPQAHPLQRHVLYRLRRSDWERRMA